MWQHTNSQWFTLLNPALLFLFFFFFFSFFFFFNFLHGSVVNLMAFIKQDRYFSCPFPLQECFLDLQTWKWNSSNVYRSKDFRLFIQCLLCIMQSCNFFSIHVRNLWMTARLYVFSVFGVRIYWLLHTLKTPPENEVFIFFIVCISSHKCVYFLIENKDNVCLYFKYDISFWNKYFCYFIFLS